ncbi:MAG: alkyl hydroperoxide reductase [Spirulina sp.]
MRLVYEKFGIDSPAYNGDTIFELPIPATYVIASNETVVHAFANADYTQRLDPKDTITALKRISVWKNPT